LNFIDNLWFYFIFSVPDLTELVGTHWGFSITLEFLLGWTYTIFTDTASILFTCDYGFIVIDARIDSDIVILERY
jgi:hypothetical protein